MISALCGVITETWRLGLISSEECERAKDLAPIRGERLPRGRALTNGELRSLFESCAKDAGTLNKRDAALLAILYGGGLRRSEAVALNIEDWNPKEGMLKVRRGKGNKSRSVPLPDSALPAIEAWISVRGDVSPGEPILFPVNKGGKIIRRRMTDQAVMKAIRTRAIRAGVASFSPHDLRRSFVSDLLDNGADLSLAQQLAGHASPKTTARYDRRPEVAKKRAVNLLHVPICR